MNTMTITSVFLTSFALLACNTEVNPDYPDKKDNETAKGSRLAVFHRSSEPNENAFTFLLPLGWTISGGITRVDPNVSGGSGNAIEAKLYMKLSSPDNRAGMGWLPDTRFFDMRRYPGQNLAAPLFPDGSNYNGMMVLRMMAPADFIREIAVPFAHPHAQNLQITGVQQLQKLSDEYRQMSLLMLGGYHFEYQTAIATMEYSENGVQYLEKMVCAIEDWGQAGAGLWSNKETWYVRAEKPLFEPMAPVFATIGHSVKLNPEWMAREIRSQQVNSNIALQTQRDIERIDREITGHRARTNSEINNEMYLNLTGQEDYTNPFTGETERGTNEWNYRWENEQGDVIYHNSNNYNPNDDADIRVKGFKRSEVRKR
ncbi:MAG: hypothetical protein FD166_907 [Bacteroidetes bacterium]|nr:MAG: hypothetical protein FD166_907 [Bacteroidota bacterium]